MLSANDVHHKHSVSSIGIPALVIISDTRKFLIQSERSKEILKTLASVFLCILAGMLICPASVEASEFQPPIPESKTFSIDRSYAAKVLTKVDKTVSQNFFDEKTARTHWKEAIQKKHDSILGSKTLLELEINMNEAIAALGASHCEFITENNETFHFLHALFGSFNKKLHRGNADYVGFETGGVGFEDSRVRFVLDGSPAERAGLEIGDRIEKVNGSVYRGHCDFIGKKDRHVSIQIRRDERLKNLRITPLSRDIYKEYVEATEKSAKVVDRNGHKLGYVHL